MSRFLIDGFDKLCNNIADSYLKVGNKSVGAIHFWNIPKGNLPHLPYTLLNPEPLGTNFNTVACYFNGSLLFIDIPIGR